jgi:hypothetical protein
MQDVPIERLHLLLLSLFLIQDRKTALSFQSKWMASAKGISTVVDSLLKSLNGFIVFT